MRKYFFAIQRSDQAREEGDLRGILLPNDAAALRHAERKISELRKSARGRCDLGTDLEGIVIVRNENHETVLCVPFLPACA